MAFKPKVTGVTNPSPLGQAKSLVIEIQGQFTINQTMRCHLEKRGQCFEPNG